MFSCRKIHLKSNESLAYFKRSGQNEVFVHQSPWGRQPGGYAPPWDFLGFRPDLKPFPPTDMLHVLTTYHPAFSTQQHTDATVTVAWMRPGQGHDALMKLILVGRHRPGKVVIT